MKAALVSATSLAALLTFEVGIDVALGTHAAMAQAFSVSPGDAIFGYGLLNTSSATTTTGAERITNENHQRNTVTISALVSSSGSNTSAILGTSGATARTTYTFSPAITGASSTTVTIAGSVGRRNGGQATSVVTLAGTAVPSVHNITVRAFGAERIGTTTTIAAVTAPNTGNGDLGSGSKTVAGTTLGGSLGAPGGSVFKGTGRRFSLDDAHDGIGAAANAAVAPAVHTISDSAGVVASFTKGSGAGANATRTTFLTLTSRGVGPPYGSNITGTSYINSASVGNKTLTGGGTMSTTKVTLPNVSAGNKGGNAALTDLTLESLALSPPNATNFSILGFVTDTVPAEAQLVTLMLDFRGPTAGNFDADLPVDTDLGSVEGPTER
jgi:hypothetical protein